MTNAHDNIPADISHHKKEKKNGIVKRTLRSLTAKKNAKYM